MGRWRLGEAIQGLGKAGGARGSGARAGRLEGRGLEGLRDYIVWELEGRACDMKVRDVDDVSLS